MNTEERLTKLREALKKVTDQSESTKQWLSDLRDQEMVVRGQIMEREMDIEVEPKLPVFEMADDLKDSLTNRGKGFFGEDEKEMLTQRQEVFEREALKKADYINEESD